MSAHSFDRFVANVVELLDLEGREVIDGAVGALRVEPEHPGRGCRLDLVDVAPGPVVVDELGLVEPDLRLREGIVVGVADGPDRGVDAFVNGGVRVYMPQPVTADSDGWHHRFYLGSLFEDAQQPTINRIVYSVSQLSTRRRVPDAFDVFVERAARPAAIEEQVSAAELMTLVDKHMLELERLREEHDQELDTARDEQSALQVELSAATGHLARLKDELLSRGLDDVVWGTLHEDHTSVPHQVQDLSEAVLAALTYLGQWLALPDSAIRELEDLDNSPNGFAWGNTTWRGLRALAAYAQDRAQGWSAGGFWEWCASGPLLGWPATPKKLSMTESDFVQNTTRLANTRVFAVDERVDESGKITMLAHLKIAEGGGPLAPRTYFYDDTAGVTGMVHVGLFGPHYLVPNKSTN